MNVALVGSEILLHIRSTATKPFNCSLCPLVHRRIGRGGRGHREGTGPPNIFPMKFTNFVYICITHGKNKQKVVIFTTRNTNIYKICELHRAVYFLHILQHLPTHLCSFTHSKTVKTLFLAQCGVGFHS